jgi:hypothetical protein
LSMLLTIALTASTSAKTGSSDTGPSRCSIRSPCASSEDLAHIHQYEDTYSSMRTHIEALTRGQAAAASAVRARRQRT